MKHTRKFQLSILSIMISTGLNQSVIAQENTDPNSDQALEEIIATAQKRE